MKKVLITGASSGIGKATALHLAQKGYQVLIAARRKERLEAMAAESPTVVGDFIVAELDVSDRKSILNFIEQHREWLKGIDVLVNNAGLALGRETFQNSKFEDIEKVISTNLTGLIELTHQILPFMVARNKGHIVNLGSVAGRTAYQGGAVYCATKAAIHIFNDALRIDLGGLPIRVSNIAPGRVETEFSLIRYKGDAEKAEKVYEGFTPLRPEDIAETIAWIIERPAHVNIQDVLIMATEQPNATTVVPLKDR